MHPIDVELLCPPAPVPVFFFFCQTEKSFKVREGEAKAREAQLKRSAPQPKTIKGQFTQKQLLLEAIQTEVRCEARRR